jgi:DNA-binding protein Fis
MLKTEEKKGYREGLIAQISDLRFRAKLALGENDTRYRLFRFSSLSRMTDKDLVSYAKHVVQTATNLLPELSIRRVDQPMLDQILQHTSLLDTAIDIQAEFMALREQKQVERTAAANELYDRIAEACEVGKKIWENKNQAFYDDYVLYGSHKAAEVTVDETEEPIVNELEN